MQPPPWLKEENITPPADEAIQGTAHPRSANPQEKSHEMPPPHYYDPAYHPHNGGRSVVQDMKDGFNEFYDRSIFEFGFFPRLAGNVVRRIIHRIKYGKQPPTTLNCPHHPPEYIPHENSEVRAEAAPPGIFLADV